VILLAAKWLFDVLIVGSVNLLLPGITIFVIANLALRFTFSTIAKSQLQAMELTFFPPANAAVVRVHVAVSWHARVGAID